MIYKIIKRTIITAVILGLIGGLGYSTYYALELQQQEEAGENLQVMFFDIGQGDASLILSPHGQRILIDGGPDEVISEKLSQHIPFFDKRLDLVILTHPHADHVGGLPTILNEYQVGNVIHTGVIHTAQTYLDFLQIAKDQNLPTTLIENPTILELAPPEGEQGESLFLEFLYPIESFLGDRVENLNDTSIVMRAVYDETRFLFTGDIELPVKRELLETWEEDKLQADVLKVAHQGSRDSLFPSWTQTVNPDYAVISAGRDNKFGHPHQEVLDMLSGLGIKTLQTNEEGDIGFVSDGKVITMMEASGLLPIGGSQ